MTFDQTLKKSLFDVSNCTWMTVSQSTIVATQNLSMFSPDEAVSTSKTGSASVTDEIKLAFHSSVAVHVYSAYHIQPKFLSMNFVD